MENPNNFGDPSNPLAPPWEPNSAYTYHWDIRHMHKASAFSKYGNKKLLQEELEKWIITSNSCVKQVRRQQSITSSSCKMSEKTKTASLTSLTSCLWLVSFLNMISNYNSVLILMVYTDSSALPELMWYLTMCYLGSLIYCRLRGPSEGESRPASDFHLIPSCYRRVQQGRHWT